MRVSSRVMSVLTWVILPLAAAQSVVGGDISNQAPYGLSATDFADATSNPTFHASFAVVGYNTSLPAGSSIDTSHNVTGWTLNISISPDVFLSSASDASVDKSKVTEATTLSLNPPVGMGFDSSGWKVCAIVFTGGLQGTGSDQNATLDGTCGAFVPSDCIKQLQVDSLTTDQCESIAVPDRCAGHFGAGNGSAYELTSSVISAKRFFAAGSAPTATGNNTALAAAQTLVWPVLLAWEHLAENGDSHDGVGWLSCVRATSSRSSGDGGKNAGNAAEVSKHALLAAIALTIGLLA